MGLMYIFPVTDNENEGDRALVENQSLVLKTYGLPMIFWGYLAAALSVVLIMWLASRAVVLKLLSYTEDATLLFLGHLVQWTLIFIPILLICFFFYEKVLTKKGQQLTVSYRLFFITVWKKTYQLSGNPEEAILVKHFMDSPNMAKLRAQQGLGGVEALKHFENKGYFELVIKTDQQKTVHIDRHSRKADLLKLKELLLKY
jgi:hypothetical protein